MKHLYCAVCAEWYDETDSSSATPTQQNCNLVTCDVTSDQMCFVLARWRSSIHDSFT